MVSPTSFKFLYVLQDAEDDNNQPPAIPETDAQELEEERQGTLL